MSPLLSTFAGASSLAYGLGRGVSAAAGFELISSSFISSTTSSVTFSAIPSNFKHLQVRIVGRYTAAVASSKSTLRFNGDTSGTYSYQTLRGDGSTLTAQQPGAYQSSTWIGNIPGASASTGYGFLIADILDYTNTTKLKTIKTLGGSAAYLDVSLHNGLWNSTSAITSILVSDVIGGASFAAGSRVSLYGQG